MAEPGGEKEMQEPINLMRGWPNPSLLPAELIRSAADHALSNPTIAAAGLLYGPDPGYEPLREALATWLTTFYRPSKPISSKRLCITGGASQNLACVLSVYADPSYTRDVLIIAPTYMLAFRMFEDAGFGQRMRAVPEDEQGLDIAALLRELRKSEQGAGWNGLGKPRYKDGNVGGRWKRAKVFKHIIYCVPTFANPSSRNMSLQRRTELVRVAREYDALVVSDDVYDWLQWSADPEGAPLEAMRTAHLPRLVDIDRALEGGPDRSGADGFGNTCSSGSFSKIAGPGIRCGWAEATEKFVYGLSQCGATASGGAPSQLTSTYLHHLVATGQLQKHISHMLLPAYASRYWLLMKAIEKYLLPLGFEVLQPDRKVIGGYFVWLALPPNLSATALSRRCHVDENVIVAAGPLFQVPGDEEALAFDGHLRLCHAWEEEVKLEEGVRRVGRVASRMIEEEKDGHKACEEYVLVPKREGDNVETFK